MKAKSTKLSFIRLEPIIEIVRTAIWTGRVGNARPVSILLIAEQESAKTEILKHFSGTKTLKYISDITSKGLASYKNEITSGRLRHIVIMDLVRILSHGKGVSDRLVQTLSSLMEEGEGETADGGGISSWGSDFPRLGALMSVTPAFHRGKAGMWRKTGFMTRFLPVRFSYSEKTVMLIHKSISNGNSLPDPRPEVLPALSQFVKMEKRHSDMIGAIAQKLGTQNEVYGFRFHRVLRTLAMARALQDGRGQVSTKDVEKIEEWSLFFGDKEMII